MKKRKGFTLIEVIISMGMLSILMVLITNLFISGSRATNSATNEFEVQSSVRVAAQSITQSVRISSATFTVSRDSFTINHHFDPYWSYIGIEEVKNDTGAVIGDRLIKLTPNHPPTTPGLVANPALPYANHIVEVLVEARQGYSFEFLFDKEPSEFENNLIEFTILVYLDGDRSNPYFTLTSKVDARNSIQVPEVTGGGDSIGAIAFRTDQRSNAAGGVAKVANVALVLDVSGSMGAPQTARNAANDPDREMIRAAKGLCETLMTSDNINVAVIPFSSYVRPTIAQTALRNLSTDYNKDQVGINTGIWGSLDILQYSGGTNMTDGLRRAYWSIRNRVGDNPDGEMNYVVLFTDGMPSVITFNNTGPTGAPNFPVNGRASCAANLPTVAGATDAQRRGHLYMDDARILDRNPLPAGDDALQNFGRANVTGVANVVTATTAGDFAAAQRYVPYIRVWRNEFLGINGFGAGNTEFYMVLLTRTITPATAVADRTEITDLNRAAKLIATDALGIGLHPEGGNDTNGGVDMGARLDPDRYMLATNANQLAGAFEQIAIGILDSFWHLEGPSDH